MSPRARGYLALLVATLVWSAPHLSVRYLTRDFDGNTQNAYRFLAAALFLLGLAFFRGRWPFRSRHKALLLLVPAVPCVLYQISWVQALYHIYPGMAALLSQTILLFSAGLAYVFIPGERPIIRSRPYLAGAAMLLVGSAGMVLASRQVDRAPLLVGVTLTLASCLAWAVYSIAIERVVRTADPVESFTGVSVYAAVALVALAWFSGDLAAPLRAPAAANFVLIASGVACIGLGQAMYFYSIRALGVAICSVVILTTPVFTALLSRVLYGEAMTAAQAQFGIVLVAGALVATLFRRARPPLD